MGSKIVGGVPTEVNLVKHLSFKGSDRLCKVDELSMQCGLNLLSDSFETLWKTMPGRVKQVPQDSTE